jgi:hypothetical protein
MWLLLLSEFTNLVARSPESKREEATNLEVLNDLFLWELKELAGPYSSGIEYDD